MLRLFFPMSGPLGLIFFAGWTMLPAKADDLPYQKAGLPIEERISDLLGRMAPAEKARQLDVYSPVPTHLIENGLIVPEKAKALWGDLGVGGMHDTYPTPETANSIQDWLKKNTRLGIPVLFEEEGLHGAWTGAATDFPAPIGLGGTFDFSLAKATGAAIASEIRAEGTNVILAPVLDLAREPRWGRVEEDFGEDPYLTGQLGLAWVTGAQGDSLNSDYTLIAEPKHFAGHGSPEGGQNMGEVHVGEREMRMTMLKSFEPAIRQGHAMAVMAAYHDIDGIPCVADPWLLKTVLRDEWGFKGFVLSDMGAIWRLYDSHHTAATPEDAVCQAINAGVDMQLYDFPSDVFQNSILQGLKDGKLDPTALDRAVSDVLRAKFMLGLFDRPVDPSVEAKVGRSPEHLELTLRSARESMCLLRNEGHLLPLSKDVKTLAVLGPYADVARLGDYSDKIKGKFPSMLAEIRKLVPTANVLYDAGKDIPAAVSKAQQADVVIMGLGEGPGESGERCDVTSLDLPGKQEQLLEAVAATGKPVVLVLQNGRPLTITWAAAHIPAILEAWYPGERGGQAITETLFGDNNPGGRLPVSFPRSLGQLPIFYNYAISSRSGYIDGSNKPLFSFGYGLSYTTFAYSDMQATPPAAGSKDDVMVSARVTNTGKVEGDEVAQLYLREDISSVVMPVKSLKGFQRIHLKPGEAQTVVFHVPQEQLAVWNPMQKWAIEPGAYTVWVGGQSDGIQSTHFTLP